MAGAVVTLDPVGISTISGPFSPTIAVVVPVTTPPVANLGKTDLLTAGFAFLADTPRPPTPRPPARPTIVAIAPPTQPNGLIIAIAAAPTAPRAAAKLINPSFFSKKAPNPWAIFPSQPATGIRTLSIKGLKSAIRAKNTDFN